MYQSKRDRVTPADTLNEPRARVDELPAVGRHALAVVPSLNSRRIAASSLIRLAAQRYTLCPFTILRMRRILERASSGGISSAVCIARANSSAQPRVPVR